MEYILVKAFEKENKEKNIFLGYTKRENRIIKGFLGGLIVSAISLMVFLFVSISRDISTSWDEIENAPVVESETEGISVYSVDVIQYGEEDCYIPVLKKTNVVSEDESSGLDDDVSEDIPQIELAIKEAENLNDSQNEGKGMRNWLYASIAGVVISFVALMIISNNYSVNNSEVLQVKFVILEKVLRDFYYPKEEKILKQDGKDCNKNDNSVVEEKTTNKSDSKREQIDIIKIDSLIGIFTDRIEKINKDDQKICKLVLTVFSVVGVIISTSFASFDKIGLNFSEWLIFTLIILSLAVILTLPIYATYLFYSTRDKIKGMLNLLKHYRVYISFDETGKKDEK